MNAELVIGSPKTGTWTLLPCIHKLKDKFMKEILTVKRNNTQNYDGYCFVPKGQGGVKVGQYIHKELLSDPKFIPRPTEPKFYCFEDGQFYEFVNISKPEAV